MFKTNEFFEFWTELKPTEFAFVDESHKITYREANIYTKRIATFIKKLGPKPGDVVCLILPNYLGWLFTFSLYRLGIATMSKNNLSSFSKELIPDWLISLDPHAEILAEKTILINENSLIEINNSIPAENLTGFIDPNLKAAFFSTSGTTGEFKWTSHSAMELLEMGTRPGTGDSFGEDGVLSLLNFGSSWVNRHTINCLIFGRTYFNCMFMNYKIAKFTRINPIKTLIGSPIQISSFLDILQQTGTELPNLKTVIMGGSSPSEKLIERIKSQLDVELYNSYGSTEAGHIAIIPVSNKQEIGLWIRPPVTLQIVDDNDQILPPMSVGHIRYHRPGMATSYYNNPVATAEHFKDGFFYPGDLGYIDHAGRLVLQGRSNEVINLGGVKINPELIDAIAIVQPGVVDCAAFSTSNEKGVEELAIALVVTEGFDRESFEAAMKKQSPYPLRKAHLVEQIPRNENGKIQRNLLPKG